MARQLERRESQRCSTAWPIKVVGACLVALPCAAQTYDGAWDGPYEPIPQHANPSNFEHCCELVHAILMGKAGPNQGRVLIIQGTGERWIWDPAAPNSVQTELHCDSFTSTDNMYCAGHSADSNGDIVVLGGERRGVAAPTNCAQPRFSYVYLPDEFCWSPNIPMLVPNPPPPNFGYYYPSSVRLPDGRVIGLGGGSAPLNSGPCIDTGSVYFVDGWQIKGAGLGGWTGLSGTQWFPGLPGSYQAGASTVDLDFNYYPLVTLIPPSPSGGQFGYILASVVTDSRNGNTMTTAGYVPRRSPTAIMGFGTSGPGSATPWSVHASQITLPGTTTPRNLLYPNGFVWPIQLNSLGLPTAPIRSVVLGGVDQNAYLSSTQVLSAPAHPAGGRPASADVYTIDQPESPSAAWTTGVLPPLTIGRVYSTAVVLPTGHLFVVGDPTSISSPSKGRRPATCG